MLHSSSPNNHHMHHRQRQIDTHPHQAVLRQRQNKLQLRIKVPRRVPRFVFDCERWPHVCCNTWEPQLRF